MPEQLGASCGRSTVLPLVIQTLASSGALAQAASIKRTRKMPMGLFKPDLYRAFFLGFGITALVMAAQFAPNVL
jgi:hypothetical protein